MPYYTMYKGLLFNMRAELLHYQPAMAFNDSMGPKIPLHPEHLLIDTAAQTTQPVIEAPTEACWCRKGVNTTLN